VSHLLGEFHGGDAVSQQSSNTVVPLVHSHTVASLKCTISFDMLLPLYNSNTREITAEER